MRSHPSRAVGWGCGSRSPRGAVEWRTGEARRRKFPAGGGRADCLEPLAPIAPDRAQHDGGASGGFGRARAVEAPACIIEAVLGVAVETEPLFGPVAHFPDQSPAFHVHHTA